MKDGPILSICIPTFNRAGYLKECLLSLLASAKENIDQLEIIVNDNASTDETALIVRDFQKVYPLIKYFCNSENIGANQNSIKVAQMGTGKYIWVFGDDDKVTIDAIPKVLERIKLGYNLIICNFSINSIDFSQQLKRSYYSTKNKEHINNHNDLLVEYHSTLGYISEVVMHNSIINILSQGDFKHYVDYGFPLLHTIYVGVSAHCNAAFIPESIVMNRSDNYSNFNWRDYFVKYPVLIFTDLKKYSYSPSSIRAAKNNAIFRNVLPHIAYQKINGQARGDIYRALWSYYKDCWVFWLICLPISILPSFALRTIRAINKG